jgi:hypothetical protein
MTSANRDATFIAPPLTRVLSHSRRALGIAGDLVLAVAVLWALPLALAGVAALLRLAWAAFT